MLYPTWMLYKRCGYYPVLRSSGSSLLTITKSSNPVWVSTFKHQSGPNIKKRTFKPSHLGYHLLLWEKIQTTSTFVLDFNILVQAVGLVLCNRLATLQFNIDLALGNPNRQKQDCDCLLVGWTEEWINQVDLWIQRSVGDQASYMACIHYPKAPNTAAIQTWHKPLHHSLTLMINRTAQSYCFS